MKRYIIAVFLLLSLQGMAQRFDADINLGANLCQIDGDDHGSYNHIGLRAGVGSSFALGSDIESPWRMVVQIAFAQKGSEMNHEPLDRSINLSYVELPVMISYNINRLRLALGIAPAVLVGAKVLDGDELNTPLTENHKRFDALPICAELRYRLATHLCLEARYENSMLSITKENSSGTFRIWRKNTGTFNRLITFGIAYQL